MCVFSKVDFIPRGFGGSMPRLFFDLPPGQGAIAACRPLEGQGSWLGVTLDSELRGLREF